MIKKLRVLMPAAFSFYSGDCFLLTLDRACTDLVPENPVNPVHSRGLPGIKPAEGVILRCRSAMDENGSLPKISAISPTEDQTATEKREMQAKILLILFYQSRSMEAASEARERRLLLHSGEVREKGV